MNNIVHTLVLRTDLDLTVGQVLAQAGHLSTLFMIERSQKGRNENVVFDEKEKAWFDGPVLMVKSVNNIEELQYVAQRANALGINVHEWRDSIYSHIIGTAHEVSIGISLGPDDADRIKRVGDLPLYV